MIRTFIQAAGMGYVYVHKFFYKQQAWGVTGWQHCEEVNYQWQWLMRVRPEEVIINAIRPALTRRDVLIPYVRAAQCTVGP